ncbi:MAG: sulfite exporter TauE/SafE family protein [Candidatus Latescibacterota bacterium]|nr:sulfite exporter TauE/SafE family protein [Candidatus Latescibacterota bacterium]
MEISDAMAANLILGIAAMITSVTGFGYAMLATPFLALLFPPQTVVPLIILTWLPLAVMLAAYCHREMNPRRIGTLLLFALPGAPVGIYGLATLSDEFMRSVIGFVTLGAAVLLLLRPSRPIKRERLALCGAGFLSGVLGGACALTGPPVALLGINQKWEHRGFRADVIGYFLCFYLITGWMLGQAGILDGDVMWFGLHSLPGVAVGYFGGRWLQTRVDGKAYRRLAIILVALGGLMALVFR